MPQITVTLNVTNEQLLAFIAANASTKLTAFKADKGTDNRALKETRSAVPGGGRGSTPKLPSPAYYYRRQKGDAEGAIPGHRRPALNLTGMKLVWSLYNQGYSYTEIGRAFKGVASVKAITITIKNVAASTKET